MGAQGPVAQAEFRIGRFEPLWDVVLHSKDNALDRVNGRVLQFDFPDSTRKYAIEHVSRCDREQRNPVFNALRVVVHAFIQEREQTLDLVMADSG